MIKTSQTEFKIKNIAVIKNLVSPFLFSTEINLSKPISRVNIEKARSFQLLLFVFLVENSPIMFESLFKVAVLNSSVHLALHGREKEYRW